MKNLQIWILKRLCELLAETQVPTRAVSITIEESCNRRYMKFVSREQATGGASYQIPSTYSEETVKDALTDLNAIERDGQWYMEVTAM